MSKNHNSTISPLQDTLADAKGLSSGQCHSNSNGRTGSSAIFTHLSNVVQRISKHGVIDLSSTGASDSEKYTTFLSNSTLADRFLGGAVTLGASIALFQLSVFLVKSAYLVIRRRLLEDERRLAWDVARDKRPRSQGKSQSLDDRYRWFHYVLPMFLAEAMIKQRTNNKTRVLYDNDDSDCSTIESEYKKPDSYFSAQVLNREAGLSEAKSSSRSRSRMCFEDLSGSCHCRSVQFRLKRVPLHLSDGNDESCFVHAYDSPGKIRYPKIPISASSQLEVAPTSVEYLRTYHSPLSRNSDPTAHAFCSGCGIHVFFAPNSEFDYVEVNGNCLDLSDFPQSPKRPIHLRVSWRPNNQFISENNVEVQWKPPPKSDSISTHLTEETTATLTSGSYEHLCCPKGHQPVTDSWRGFLHLSTPRSLDQYEYLRHSSPGMTGNQGEDSSFCGKPAIQPPPSASPLNLPRSNSSGSSMTSDIIPGPLSSSSSTASASAARKKKSGGISLADRRNLVHYMKRHLATPKEVDEEVLMKEV